MVYGVSDSFTRGLVVWFYDDGLQQKKGVENRIMKYIMKTIDKTLKDYGIDWILAVRNDGSEQRYKDLMTELELALSKVID